MLTFLALFLVGISVRSYYYGGGSSVLLFFTLTVFLIINFILGGRTGVFLGIILFAGSIFLIIKKLNVVSLIFFVLLMLIISIPIYTTFLNYFADIGYRGYTLGAREFVWACYLDHLSFYNFLIGFDKLELKECIEPILGRVSLESSFLSLQSYIGIGSIPVYLIIFRKTLINLRRRPILGIVLLSFVFRLFTGEFVFFTVLDWMLYHLLFIKNNVSTNASYRY